MDSSICELAKQFVFLGNKVFKMIIRKGIPTDMSSVLELIKELAVFEKEPNAVVISVEDLIRDGFAENPLFHTFVAEVNQEIIGIALYYYRYSTWKGKTIHLEDLIVKEDKRGTGAGFALYSEIIAQGKRDNVFIDTIKDAGHHVNKENFSLIFNSSFLYF